MRDKQHDSMRLFYCFWKEKKKSRNLQKLSSFCADQIRHFVFVWFGAQHNQWLLEHPFMMLTFDWKMVPICLMPSVNLRWTSLLDLLIPCSDYININPVDNGLLVFSGTVLSRHNTRDISVLNTWLNVCLWLKNCYKMKCADIEDIS